MGKRREKERDQCSGDGSSPSRKKPKKHKKHKKQKKQRNDPTLSDEEIDVVNDEVTSQDEGKGLKLKIKFGGKTLKEVVTSVNDSDVDIANDEEDDEDEGESWDKNQLASDNSKYGGPLQVKNEEEEKWLEALEKGELDDKGAVKKKERDVSLMTSRQRALHGESVDGETELLQLPMYPEKSEAENEEVERKRKLKAKKRKQLIEKQTEETKAQTIEKLLTKGGTQKSKKENSNAKPDKGKTVGPCFRYTDNKQGIFISCPEDMDFPMQSALAREPPLPVLCSVDGCSNQKKYACSRTKLPVCSLKCYKLLT